MVIPFIEPGIDREVVKEDVFGAFSQMLGYPVRDDTGLATQDFNELADFYGTLQLDHEMKGRESMNRINSLIRAIQSEVADADIYMDWTRGSPYFPSPMSYVRSGSETMFDWKGDLHSFGANVLPRLDGSGAQVQPQRTNFVPYSNDFSQWSVQGTAVISPSSELAPDGETCFQISTDPGGPNRASINLTGTLTGNHVFYAILKPGTLGLVNLRVFEGGGIDVYRNFDLSTGAASGGIGTATPFFQVMKDGWILVGFTVTLTGSGTVNVRLGGSTDPSSLSGDFLAWHAGVEAGTFATTPIVTTGSAVTRPGGLLSKDLSGFTGLAQGVGGVFQVDIQDDGSQAFIRPLEINDAATGNNRIGLIKSSGATVRLDVVVSGVAQASITIGEWRRGVQTFAIAASQGYAMARRIGDVAPSPVTTGEYPATDLLGVLGHGRGTASNVAGIAKRLALGFGPQDQSSFDYWWTLAQQIHAATPQFTGGYLVD